MGSLFIIGSLWFWILLIIECLFLFWIAENDAPGKALLSLIALFLLLKFFGNFDVFNYFVIYPKNAILIIITYFVTGVVWSIGKWWFYLRNRYQKYLQQQWRKEEFGRPVLKEHKSRIMTWMMYWPWSMIWTIINDPVRKIFEEIYTQIASVYEKITSNIYKDVEESKTREEKP